MRLQELFTMPLSGLYAFGVWVRNLLYEEHILPSHAVGLPTICVGNLAVGGTGKTPHVEYLLRLLSPRYRVAVLSRGYKRRTRGFVLADDSATAATIGDEAMQIHTKFPDVAVAVCEDRVEGVRRLQQRVEGLQVVILDDAFQHRALRCGYNILLTPYDRLYIDDHMLPWGRLRDLPGQAVRAHLVVVTKCPDDMRPIDRRVVENRLALASFQHLLFSSFRYATLPLQGRPLVVTGIARTDYLMAHIRSRYPEAELLAFADHHAFTEREIATIARRAEGFDFVLTTEKDYQRLRLTALPDILGERLHTLPIEVDWGNRQPEFDRHILDYVREALRTAHP